MGLLVNKAVCVLTLFWYPPPPTHTSPVPHLPFALSLSIFSPPSLLWGNKGPHSHSLDSLPKESLTTKGIQLPPSQALAEWEPLGCG